jgi:hypothetical protein
LTDTKGSRAAGTRPFLFARACGKLATKAFGERGEMNKKSILAALVAGASLVAACGQADDGSPTAAENQSLNQISEDLDASPDSLVAEEGTLGNGEAPAETGGLPVVGNEIANDAANGQ